MEFLALLPKALLDIALGLLKIKKDDRTRQRLADALSSVAKCISDIGDAIEANQHPTKLCGELDAYIAHLESFVERETDTETAKMLILWLRHVAEVPGLSRIDIEQVMIAATMPKWSQHQRFEQAESVQQIAGLVDGIAKLIRI